MLEISEAGIALLRQVADGKRHTFANGAANANTIYALGRRGFVSSVGDNLGQHVTIAEPGRQYLRYLDNKARQIRPPRIWFHGTNEASAVAIQADGFKPGTYFAKHLEDALGFGGDHVFWVALHGRPKDGGWQMVMTERVPTSAIVKVVRYAEAVIEDHPDRREAIFAANAT